MENGQEATVVSQVPPDENALAPTSPAIADVAKVTPLNPSECRILHQLTIAFNKTVKCFFENDVVNTIETIVENKLADYGNQSTQNLSALDQSTIKNDLEERLANLEKLAGPKMDKINTKIDNLTSELNMKNKQILELTEENRTLKNENVCLSNENLKLHDKEANTEDSNFTSINQRLVLLEIEWMNVLLD